MKALGLIITSVFILLAVFTAVNWSVLTTFTPLSFIVFDVQGPLGVILLAIMLGLVLLVVAYALVLRTSWLMESRRLNRQLEDQRKLAQEAESSRFISLQQMIKNGFESLRTQIIETDLSAIARTEHAEQILLKSIEEATNGISANLGYIDDKLKGKA